MSITVGNRVWYVDNSSANGDGRSTSPFSSLAAVNAAGDPDLAGDIIYVRSGTGTYNGGITLENSQTLWGENEALVVGGFTLQAAGADPTLTNDAGSGVTLAQNNTLKGFTVGDTTVADIVDGNASVGNLAISNVNLTGTGQAVDIDQGGALNVAIDNLTSTGSAAQGVQLGASGAALTGTFTASTGSISGAAGAAFLVGDGAGSANTGGTLAIAYGGSISSTTGRAVDIQDRAAGAGDIAFSGNITHASGSSEGIFLDDNAAGNIAFSGATKAINTTAGSASAISISDQSGGSVSFSNGGINIDTTAGVGINLTGNTGVDHFHGRIPRINSTTGVGFNATGGGAITVQDAGNIDQLDQRNGTQRREHDDRRRRPHIREHQRRQQHRCRRSGERHRAEQYRRERRLVDCRLCRLGDVGSGGTIQNTTGAGISLTNTRDIAAGRDADLQYRRQRRERQRCDELQLHQRRHQQRG